MVEKTGGRCSPARYEPIEMAIVPIMIGMIAAVMPILPSALYISRVPSTRATAISPTNAQGANTRLRTMYAPAPTPTPIAAGRLRPARP